MIPKIIHYCWFGGNSLPELAVSCIESWKKYLPDYDIKEWNESNYDLESCDYVKEAYAAKKWAFVSDYARFDVLYHYGGLYFDTDVEIIRTLDDLIESGAFMGCESVQGVPRQCLAANPGLGLAANPGLSLYKRILEHYKKSYFLYEEGTLNMTTVVTRTMKILVDHGYDPTECHIQCVDGITIYPPEYFGAMSYKTGKITITDHTRSIHHYMASWKTEEEMAMKKMEDKAEAFFGVKTGRYLSKIIVFPLRVKMKYKQYGIWGTIHLIWKRMKQKRR